MALNLDIIGKKLGPITKEYNYKDVILYALGVGAGFNELEYVYEKDLKVIPSFAIAATFDFMKLTLKANLNLAGILHGEQELTFHNPFPIEGTLTTEGKITRMYDKGKDKGALVMVEYETYHSNGNKLFTSVMTIFSRFDGGFGGENAPKKEVYIPDRAPDFEIEDAPSANQPIIYRLSGDMFTLHIDPDFAKNSGFEKPIMHGLCTHGFATRSLIEKLIPGKPELLRKLDCRFTKVLYPGIPIKTLIWKIGEGKAAWRVVNKDTGEFVIDNGIFEYGEIPKDEIRFDDRVAIVTGAGGGLGKVYALELARRGAKVVVNDFGGSRDGGGTGASSPADQVVAEIKEKGGEAVANYDNVATVEGGANIVKTALEAFGTVDILINNAGILRDKSFVKMEPQNWKAVLDVHLNGAYNVTRPAFQVMKEKGYGRIVMTTSAAGIYGNYGQTNYSAAKMALIGLMNTLKLEGERYGIKVNTIAPLAASRLTEDVLPPHLLAQSKPEFVMPMTVYLCSDRCEDSGRIYNAGVGTFNRVALVTGPGITLGDKDNLPTLEDIISNRGAINTLEGGKEYWMLNQQVMDALASTNAPKAAAKKGAVKAPVPQVETAKSSPSKGGGSVDAIFAEMNKGFKADAAKGLDVVFQYRISGNGGGDWNMVIKDGTLSINKGVHNTPTTTMKISASDFIALRKGELDPMQAFTTGKLQVEGDMMKAQLLGSLFR
ncbi:SDR family NAD(P)-dependent oxidoreductase [Deltaproteobacteria bacterium TL4]